MNALKVTETDRNSQMYMRTSVTTFLISSPAPPLAPCSASSLNFFSSVIQSSRVLFLLFCFVFSCVRLRRRFWVPLSFVLRNWKFSCAKKISTTTMQKKTKNSEDWQQQGKRTQKVVKICAHYLMQGTDVVRTRRTMIASLVILSTRKLWKTENDGKSRFWLLFWS